ncbi:TetR/AcrR family transcriptional regulator [Plantactinospora sp. GCM10030261]|uniref:TetR/AcrR family transcriptional regulator n=1 Tax=Plantactinospora sp. GCM10030261 TaxID=3273420 RepID=UPI00361D1E8E
MIHRSSDPEQHGGSRLRAAKRAAITAGALEVFARDGYARASVDAIAVESGVSTRTIYKHFADKAALFAAVIADSAASVAAEESALIAHHLDGVTRAEEIGPALVDFARTWLSDTTRSSAHQALIRQVHAEATHLGHDIVATWWRAGPGRVRAALAERLARWADEGLLRVADAEQAAVHFAQLVSAAPGPPTSDLTASEREAWIAAGVQVFVRGYGT